ncbi:MAG: type II toxin-antitoxin system HicB family antitoxin [Deltaproteobacteria bacterium]|nr:type II toxin-antitoxin system HicB family antitoxin [Deltaproteobacteria bacterium]
MQVRVQFSANLPVKITRRPKWFVASCSILDVHSQGETEEDARHNLGEALSLFFVSCFERGVLDDVLKDCGFKADKSIPVVKQGVTSDNSYISVPIPFLVNQDLPDECHA